MRRFLPPLLCLFWASSACAGAWLLPENQGYFILNDTYFRSDHYWDASGDSHKQASFNKLEVQPYAEYGLTGKLTIGADAYAQYDWQGGVDNWGLADPELWARMKLWDNGSQLVSIQPLVKLPSTFYYNDLDPRGGSHSTDEELSLLFGSSAHIVSDRDYIDSRIGYRERNQGLSPQWKADLSVGISPWDHWILVPAVRYVGSTKIDAQTFSESGDLDYRLLKAELGLLYKYNNGDWWQFNVFDHLDGTQTGNGEGISIGFAHRF